MRPLLLLLLLCSTASADPTVTLQTDNDEAALHQITGEAQARAGGTVASAISFRMVCRAPCNVTTTSNARYFVDGDGMTRSNTFLLPQDGNVTLDLKAGKTSTFVLGVTAISIGSSLVVAGLATAIAGVDSVPGVLLGVGVPMTTIGIPVTLKGRTTVKLTKSGSVAVDLRRGALTF